jgi:hypothetical protein
MSRSIGPSSLVNRGAALALLLGGPCLHCADDSLASVQEAVGQWSKVRAETVRVESEWEWQHTLMQSTLDALRERIGQLEAKRDELQAKTAAERRETAELTESREALAAAESKAVEHLRSLDARLFALRASLPPRLLAALELPFRSIGSADLSTGERMQYTETILNRCELFNRGVTFGEEMVALPGAQPKLMEVVYWGLSHAYALDTAANSACLGSPKDGGWTWTAAPELVGPVRKLIAVARDKAEPELIQVPVPVNGRAESKNLPHEP